ncbi:hypothetical protein N7450_007740 [Penicillium hetheringtonii]|uniref:Uncharacterized protein n=1 Tax=Penicillium hetheringtonii TaxID=911720 RepID=A0AAD6GQ94_9EURO|nr:hypothetical protein N7450_007740 [Penicillium hetheringtonii]
MGPTSVRPNIFQQGLNRRHASTAPPNVNMNIPPGTNGLSNRPSHRLKPTASDPSSARNIKISENKEIVVRDKNGGYKLDVPVLPDGLIGEDGEELGDLEGDESGEIGLERTEVGGRDKEKFDAALVEMMLRRRNRQSSGEPDGELQLQQLRVLNLGNSWVLPYAEAYGLLVLEILDIVQESLRKKVASLDDDSWMFEPERDIAF